nr:hypothetical protein [Steroidobacter denitrificans]
MSEEKIEIHDAHQRRILLIVLALNLALAAGSGSRASLPAQAP